MITVIISNNYDSSNNYNDNNNNSLDKFRLWNEILITIKPLQITTLRQGPNVTIEINTSYYPSASKLQTKIFFILMA